MAENNLQIIIDSVNKRIDDITKKLDNSHTKLFDSFEKLLVSITESEQQLIAMGKSIANLQVHTSNLQEIILKRGVTGKILDFVTTKQGYSLCMTTLIILLVLIVKDLEKVKSIFKLF